MLQLKNDKSSKYEKEENATEAIVHRVSSSFFIVLNRFYHGTVVFSSSYYRIPCFYENNIGHKIGQAEQKDVLKRHLCILKAKRLPFLFCLLIDCLLLNSFPKNISHIHRRFDMPCY